MNYHPKAVNFVRVTPSTAVAAGRSVIRIRGWFDENEGPLSADAVKFYKAGSTTEDPTIRIVPGTVPKIVFDDPLNKDIVQAIELEIEIADNDGFENAPAGFTDDQLVGLRDIVLQTDKLDTTVAPYDTLPESSDPDRPALQPYKHPENDGIVLPEGLNVVKMEFVEKGPGAEYVVAAHLLEVAGAPVVVLDEIPEDFSNTSSVTISGYVLDPVADITEGSSGNIKEITVNGTPVSFTQGTSPLPMTDERPYPKKFSFSADVSLDTGANCFLVEATNAIGKKGHDAATVAIGKPLSDSSPWMSPADEITLDLDFQGVVPTDSVQDTVLLNVVSALHGGGILAVVLSEPEQAPSSNEYSDDAGNTAVIHQPFDVTQQDVFDADVSIPSEGVHGLPVTFQEKAPGTLVFRTVISLPARTPVLRPYVEWVENEDWPTGPKDPVYFVELIDPTIAEDVVTLKVKGDAEVEIYGRA